MQVWLKMYDHLWAHKTDLWWNIVLTVNMDFEPLDETMGIEDPGVGLVAFMETVSTVIQGISNHWEFRVSRRNLLKNY